MSRSEYLAVDVNGLRDELYTVRDTVFRQRKLIQQLRDALVYHQDQTLPIFDSIHAIAAADAALKETK